MLRILLMTGALILGQQAMAKAINMTALHKKSDFKKLDTKGKLAKINKMIEAKELKGYSAQAYVSRLLFESVKEEKTIEATLNKYAAIRKSHKRLPSATELEKSFVVRYLSESKAAKGKDTVTQLKLLKGLEDSGKISWPTIASVYTGLLTHHLATNAAYQKKNHYQKIQYVRELESKGVIKSLTAAEFLKGLSFQYLSSLPKGEQKKKAASIGKEVGFFTKSTVKAAYMED